MSEQLWFLFEPELFYIVKIHLQNIRFDAILIMVAYDCL